MLEHSQGVALSGQRSGPATRQSKSIGPVLRRRRRLPFIGFLVVAAALLIFYLTRALPVPKVSNYVQLTTDGLWKSLVGTDGSRLFLAMGNSTSDRVAQVSISGARPGPDSSGLQLN